MYLFHELPRSAREKVLKESYRVLKVGGVLGICDSIQLDDDPLLNEVLERFPIYYHEPFYRDYNIWYGLGSIEKTGFRDVLADHQLISKYWTAIKP